MIEGHIRDPYAKGWRLLELPLMHQEEECLILRRRLREAQASEDAPILITDDADGKVVVLTKLQSSHIRV